MKGPEQQLTVLFLEPTSYFYCPQKEMEILSLNKRRFSVSTDLCGWIIGFKFIFLHSPRPHPRGGGASLATIREYRGSGWYPWLLLSTSRLTSPSAQWEPQQAPAGRWQQEFTKPDDASLAVQAPESWV